MESTKVILFSLLYIAAINAQPLGLSIGGMGLGGLGTGIGLGGLGAGLGMGGLGTGLGLGGMDAGIGVGGLGTGLGMGLGGMSGGFANGGGFGGQDFGAGASGVGNQGGLTSGVNGLHNVGGHNQRLLSVNQVDNSGFNNIGGGSALADAAVGAGRYNGYQGGATNFGNVFGSGSQNMLI